MLANLKRGTVNFHYWMDDPEHEEAIAQPARRIDLASKTELAGALRPNTFRKMAVGPHVDAFKLYTPPATCAITLNPDGSAGSPANPYVFASDEDARVLVKSLHDAGMLKTAEIVDDPGSENGRYQYCNDHRKVLTIRFSALGFAFDSNVQLLLTELKRLTYPGWHWAITPNGELNRVG